VGASSVLTRGSLVLVRTPFSDLSASKPRPAIVVASVGRGDFVLVQITSNPYGDDRAVHLTNDSFVHGGLDRTSYARPGKVFMANETLIARSVGQLSAATLEKVLSEMIWLLRQE
jgi:mRNA interferase MazF